MQSYIAITFLLAAPLRLHHQLCAISHFIILHHLFLSPLLYVPHTPACPLLHTPLLHPISSLLDPHKHLSRLYLHQNSLPHPFIANILASPPHLLRTHTYSPTSSHTFLLYTHSLLHPSLHIFTEFSPPPPASHDIALFALTLIHTYQSHASLLVHLPLLSLRLSFPLPHPINPPTLTSSFSHSSQSCSLYHFPKRPLHPSS